MLAAVSAAISYAIDALREDESRPAPLPTELLLQARRAARHRVSLDKVLRCYIAGHMLLEDFIKGAELAGDRGSVCPQEALRLVAAVLDHLVASISTEYAARRRLIAPHTAGSSRASSAR